jgi:hypothetical protein
VDRKNVTFSLFSELLFICLQISRLMAIYPLPEYLEKLYRSSPIYNLTTTHLAAFDLLKSTQRGRLKDKVKLLGALLLISIAKTGARGTNLSLHQHFKNNN